jgi:DNA-binding NarL/FixJ family response regulator
MPPKLRSSRIAIGTEQYLLLSHPLPCWELPSELTCAESDVVLELLDGKSRAQIASKRRSSLRTVTNLLARVFEKLGVQSRIELASKLFAR